MADETVQNLGSLPAIGPGGRPGRTQAKRVDQGLTPKAHSTGGKQRMGGISRAGNEQLGVLLVTSATSVIKAAMKPDSQQMTDWLRAMLLRKPRKVVAVSLTNKMARVAWALMTRGEVYRRSANPTGVAVA